MGGTFSHNTSLSLVFTSHKYTLNIYWTVFLEKKKVNPATVRTSLIE